MSDAMHHIGLNCTDPIAIERWYAKHFGFERLRVYLPGPDQVVVIGNGGVALELFPAEGEASAARRARRPDAAAASATSRSSSTTSTRSSPRWATTRRSRSARSTWATSSQACASPGSPTRKETSLSSTRATRTRRTRRRSSTLTSLADLRRAGGPQPLGATVDDGGVNFSLFSEEATGVELLLFDAHDDLHPVATLTFDPVVNRSFHFWHMYVRGLTAGYHYAYRVARARRGARATASTPRRCCSTRTRRGTRTRSGSRATPACRATTSTSSMRARDRRRRAATTGRATSRCSRPMSEPSIYELHVRGFTMSPTSGVEHPGHVRGRDREDPVPAGARRHRGRAAARLRLRRARGARRSTRSTARRCGTSGATTRTSTSRRRRATACSPDEGAPDQRVPRHGQGAAQGRDRGDPRRRLQPHRRGQPPGPDDQLQGPRERRLLPARTRPSRSTTWTTPAAGTRSTQPPDRARSSSSTACTTGSRRCTSTASASTRARCSTAAATARRWSSRRSSGGIELSEDARRHEGDRRGVGRRRALPDRPVPGLALGGVERPLPRRRPPLRPRRPRPRRRRSPRASPAAPTCTRAAAAARPTASTSSLPRRLHAQRPRLLQREAQRGQRRGQPRRQRRQPRAGTAASRARPTTRRSTRSASRQMKNFATILLPLAGRADVRRRRRGRPHAARQQQRLLPGQRAQLVRLDAASSENADALPLLQADDRVPQAPPEPAPALVLHRRATTGAASRTSPGTASSSTGRSGTSRVARVLAFTLGRLRSVEPDLHVMMNMDDGAPRLRASRDVDGRALAACSPTRRWPRPTTSPSRAAEPPVTDGEALHGRGPQHRHPRIPRQLTTPRRNRHRWTRECTSPSPTRSPASVAGFDGGRGHASALQHDRRPRVRGRAHADQTLRRADAQPRRAVRRRDRPDARHARPRAAFLFAYGVFYPEGGSHALRGQAHRLRRPHARTTSSSSARTGGSARSARSPTSTCDAQFGRRRRSTTATTARRSALEGDKLRRRTRQETDTISRLVYGFATAYLLTGEDRYLEAAEKGTEYLREHMRIVDAAEGIAYWYHGVDVSRRQASRRSSPPSSATTTTRSRPTSRSTRSPARPRPTASPATRGSCATSS